MLVSIIIIACIIGIFFLVSAVSLGGFVYNGMKKNDDIRKKCLNILIPSSIIWLLLIIVNTILIIIYWVNNGENIIDGIIRLLQSIPA